MPTKLHSSTQINSINQKSHSSYPNLNSDSIISKSFSSPPTNLTSHNRSKVNLVVKKRHIGLSRNNTSVNLSNKSIAPSHPKKALNTLQRRAPKRGAFKGALDPDLNDDLNNPNDDLNNPSNIFSSSNLTTTLAKKPQKDDEAWVSEPSTRCATPTPLVQPESFVYNSSNQFHSSKSRLALQLPNPLSSSPSSFSPPRPSPVPQTPFASLSQAELANQTQIYDPINPQTLRSQHFSESTDHSINHNHLPADLSKFSSVKQPEETSKPLDLDHPITPVAQDNSSISPDKLKNHHPSSSPRSHSSLIEVKQKISPALSQKHRSTQRSSIKSVCSLSSIALFHNDILFNQNPSRQGLKRVDSVGSVVLPPKVDTTEAVITLNSRATFHPTLNAISDFHSDLSELRSNPPSHSAEPLPLSSAALHDSKVNLNQMHPLSSGSKTRSTTLEPSECTRRLKRYSHANGQSHHINVKPTNDFSSGLMSSLLSPQLTFKSRKSQTPGTLTESGSGYFDSFKSLVGLSTLAVETTKVNGSLTKPESGHQPSGGTPPRPGYSPRTYTQNSKNVSSTIASSSLPKYDKTFINQNHLHGGPVRSNNPKPIVPGFITTCGAAPVISKFLGPRPVSSCKQTEPLQPSNMGVDRSQGLKEERSGETEEGEANQSTTGLTLHASTLNQDGSSIPPKKSGTDSTGSLSRIQKKLLMERDRPISPTLYEQPNHQTIGHEYGHINNQSSGIALNGSSSPSPIRGGGSIGSGGGNNGALPPPSYLIRSLGGQTGPLPLIPLSLLPSTRPPTTELNSNFIRSHTPAGSIKVINATSNEKKNAASASHVQKATDVISPTTPQSIVPTQQQQQETSWLNSSIETGVVNGGGRLNEPALKAKQAISIKLWRNSLIDEVEQILTDHESNTRFRNPLIESFQRVSIFNRNFSSNS